MKSKQDDGLHSIHGTAAPARPADSNRVSAAAAAAASAATAASKGDQDVVMSPPSSGSATAGFGHPVKRDDSRDNPHSPGTPKGPCSECGAFCADYGSGVAGVADDALVVCDDDCVWRVWLSKWR